MSPSHHVRQTVGSRCATITSAARFGSPNQVPYSVSKGAVYSLVSALGNAYPMATDPEDARRLNQSEIHIDFMIGSNEVTVTGLTEDGDEVPVLAGGDWQI